MEITSRQLKAVHEAAHAVGAEHYDWRVGEVVLQDTREVVAGVPSTITGWTGVQRPRASIHNIGLLIALALCGYAVTRRIVTDEWMVEECAKETGLDWQTIEQLFQEANLEAGHRLAAFYEGVGQAEAIVTEHTKAINRIADELVKNSRITGDEVRRIIKEEKSS
jgi:hypothetical protein